MSDPFERALQRAMSGRAQVIDAGLGNTIRMWAVDDMPEGEIRIVDLSKVEQYTVTCGDGVTEHWVKAPGRKPVRFARSGFRWEGNTLKYWVEAPESPLRAAES